MSEPDRAIDAIKDQLTKVCDDTEDNDLELLFEELDALQDHIADLMQNVDTRIREVYGFDDEG